MKKNFLLYIDSLDVIEELTDEQCGKLLRKMKAYHDGTIYECDDKIVNILFINFKNQFDRDLEKYKKVCERNSNNGKKGGRPKNPLGYLETQQNPKKPKKADNDNDKDTDKDINTSVTKKEKSHTWIDDHIANATEEDKKHSSYIVLYAFNKLGYKPSKEETLETFKTWLGESVRDYGVDKEGEKKFKLRIKEFYEYWSGTTKKKRQGKNWKTTLTNNLRQFNY